MSALRRRATSRGLAAILSCGLLVVLAAFVSASAPGSGSGQLAPTPHPLLPATASDMWLVPSETAATARAATQYQPLVDAATELAAGRYDSALSLASRPSLAGSALADYASYYKGLAQLRLDRAADARATFDALQERKLTGYLAIATSLGEAEAAAALGDHADALAIYEKLTSDKTAVNEQILCQAGGGGTRPRRSPQDRREPAADLLRVSAHRRGSRCRRRARAAARHHRSAGLQTGSRAGDPAVWSAPLFGCARRLCCLAGRGQRR